MNLGDINHAVKNKTYDFYQVVKAIYDMHYTPVNVSYEKALIEFALLKKKNLRL